MIDIGSFDKQIGIPLYTLIIIGMVLVSIVFALLSVVWYLLRKVRVLSRVRYGFGGKPLFSLLLLVGISIAIPMTLVASKQTVDYINYASAQKDVVINISQEIQPDGKYKVVFMAYPTVDGVTWAGHKYNITWKIYSENYSFEKVEEERGKDFPSYFEKELPYGQYVVAISVEGYNFNVSKEQELILKP